MPKQKRWAICQYYEPFTMGGSVWHWKRFEVEADDVDLVKKFKGFVFYCPVTEQYRVHEATTGGLLGEGDMYATAVADANHNIKITPDLREQMTALGDTTQFTAVPAVEALARIAKHRKTNGEA